MNDKIYKKIAIFDMDGVLVLTNRLKAKAHVKTVNQFGGAAEEELYNRVLGQPHSVVRSTFMEAGEINVEPEIYTNSYREIYRQLIRTQLQMAPGILQFLNKLSKCRFQLAVVSSSTKRDMNMILKGTNLESYFVDRVSGDEVNQQKPSPEPYLKALKNLGVEAKDAVVFEDSISGILAANAAGIPVIAVRHALNMNQDFSIARYTIDSFLNREMIIQMMDKLLVPVH